MTLWRAAAVRWFKGTFGCFFYVGRSGVGRGERGAHAKAGFHHVPGTVSQGLGQ